MVWVNSFSVDKLPPKTDKPLIVIGNSNIHLEADVFIPIATPGLDCSGTLFRVDSSVILPLKKVRENDLPTLSKIVDEIEKQL
jgi:formylmethanofuran dehydrogenase subunit B